MCRRGVVAACTAPHTPGVGESGEGMCNMKSDKVLHLGITINWYIFVVKIFSFVPKIFLPNFIIVEWVI